MLGRAIFWASIGILWYIVLTIRSPLKKISEISCSPLQIYSLIHCPLDAVIFKPEEEEKHSDGTERSSDKSKYSINCNRTCSK